MIYPITQPFQLPKQKGNEFRDGFQADAAGTLPLLWTRFIGANMSIQNGALGVNTVSVGADGAYITMPSAFSWEMEAEVVFIAGNRDFTLNYHIDANNRYYAGMGSWNNFLAIGRVVASANTKIAGLGLDTDVQYNKPYRIRFTKIGRLLQVSTAYGSHSLGSAVSVTDTNLIAKGTAAVLFSTVSTSTAKINWIRVVAL